MRDNRADRGIDRRWIRHLLPDPLAFLIAISDKNQKAQTKSLCFPT